MKQLNEILQQFDPISLEEMDTVRLMNRTDSKFVLHRSKVEKLLRDAMKSYRILEINGIRDANYRTTYFDTDDFKMYTAHQNGKLNRYKIRIREYLVSGIGFLEIKFKSNKGRTIKERIKHKEGPVLREKEAAFISKNTPFTAGELRPRLHNSFTRLTLVHRQDKERVTIDFNLRFRLESGESLDVPFFAIAEVKRERLSMSSDFIRILKKHGIRAMRISKYCIGSVLVNKSLKHNRFKPKIITLKKLENEPVPDFIASAV
ncbi:MAG: polyphosphate polymerase domain-containing protein [Bacteroidetes bacterium]|nr:polyphosphate polymerase domain-containing protein [Bacteroidota bacterium]